MNAASMNQSITKPMNKVTFKVGAKFTATVKAVHDSGVNIVMPDDKGSGVILPKCWGDGARRQTALAAIKPGDELPVTVVKFHPQAMTLLLVLNGGKKKAKQGNGTKAKANCNAKAKQRKAGVAKSKPAGIQRKPDYTLIAPGTTLLVDGANLIGKLGADDSVNILRTVRAEIESRGYKVALFLDYRAYSWLKHNQESEEKLSALVQFVEKGGVSLVNGEADLVILQCARQIPETICISDDGFLDYHSAFGDIVGTPRVRRFTWIEIGGRRLLSIDGFADAIEINKEKALEVPVEKVVEAEETAKKVEEAEEPAEKVEEAEAPVEKVEEAEASVEKRAAIRHLRPVVSCGRDAVLALGNSMLAKGDAKKAFDCFDLAVRKGSSDGYRAMARAYEAGDGVEKDAKKAVKFSKLAVKMERKARDCQRRLARKFAMVRDGAFAVTHDHMSANDIVACSLLARRRLENDIHAHRRAKRISRNVVHSRAA